MTVQEPTKPHRSGLVKIIMPMLILLAVVLGLQIQSGAYQSEYGGDPDEAAHFITGLMVHDYVKQLAGSDRIANPLAYAEKYYEHYPKVALGHYPPGLYAFEALWMALGGSGTTSMMAFMAAQCWLWALLVFYVLRERFECQWALLAAILMAALPVVQDQTARVMADVMLSIFCLGALWAWLSYMRKPGWLPAATFGILAAGAIYIKGSGIILAFLPPIAILSTWRLDLLKKPSLWASAAIVALLCAPWMYITTKISSEGFQEPASMAFTAKAVRFYALVTWEIFGTAGILFMLFGFWRCSCPCAHEGNRGLADAWATLVALISGFYLVHCVIPVGLDARYFLPALPAFFALIAFGFRESINLLAQKLPRPAAIAIPCVVLLASYGFESFELRKKTFTGMDAVSAHILAEDAAHPHAKILISSGPMGEGALIGSLAASETRLGHRVLRSSKYVSESDWRGRDYAVQFEDTQALVAALAEDGVRWVAVDDSLPQNRRLEHHTLIADAMRAARAYRLAGEFPLDRGNRGGQGTVLLYVADEIVDR